MRWNFVIVGGIGGFSRLPVMLVCTNNNKPDTLLNCFLAAVNEYDLPSRVRTDKGLENVQIADYMIEKRRTDRGSIITGRSTHNKKIERLWRDVFQGVLSFFYHLFYFLENLLDPLNINHIAALHHTYLLEINNKLRIWQRAWANHRMRTIETSPLRLWIAGQAQDPVGLDIPLHDLSQYGVEGDIDDETDEHEEGRPIFFPPVVELNERCLTELNALAPNPSNYWFDQYMTNQKVSIRLVK